MDHAMIDTLKKKRKHVGGCMISDLQYVWTEVKKVEEGSETTL